VSTFSITRGNPTPEEIAIAISVLQAAAGANAVQASARQRSNWAAPASLHRPTWHRVGRGAWASSQRMR
jgi:hypothetical protein